MKEEEEGAGENKRNSDSVAWLRLSANMSDVCRGGNGVLKVEPVDDPTAQLHQERLVPMPSRNRPPSAAMYISFGRV